MTIDITQIIISIATIIIGILARYAVPYIKEQITTYQWDKFMEIVSVSVNAAEQLKVTGVINDKLSYATNQVQDMLDNYGLTFDPKTIRAAIESEVKQSFNLEI